MENAAVVRPAPISCIRDRSIEDRASLMSTSGLFAGLTTSECNQIAASSCCRVATADEFLFMQGQPARSLMLVQSGTAKLTQLSSGGDEVILGMSGRGDSIGLMADPTEAHSCYACSAQAMEKLTVLVWEYGRFRAFSEQFPRIRANMNAILLRRLEEMHDRFREIATERVAKRLALALLRLEKQVGKPHHAGVQVTMSRGELAQIVGTTLFTISRILSRWDEEGVVLARREAVVVRNSSYRTNHPDFA